MKSKYVFKISDLHAPLKSIIFNKKKFLNLIELKSRRFKLFKIIPQVHEYLKKENRRTCFIFYSQSYKILVAFYLYKRR